MSQPITYHYGNLAHYTSTLGTTSALLAQCHDDLRNLAAALSEGHLGSHSDAWQAALAQVNVSLGHFSDVVARFGTTHDTVTDIAMATDASLASGIHGV